MNTQRLQAVRDIIAAHPSKYDQDQYLHPCGSPACIAGWAAHLSLREGESLSRLNLPCGSYVLNERGTIAAHVMSRAGEWLGLTPLEKLAMFEGDPIDYWEDDGEMLSRPSTVQEALAMLDHAIKRQKVEWQDLSA